MRPNQTYSFLGKVAISPDATSLIQCYQPIIGLPAFALYHFLCATNDKGSGRYRFSSILNHLNVGMQVLEQALELLTAMKLLILYQEEEHFTFVLQAPLSSQEFLSRDLYRALLAKKIGESAVEQMQVSLPDSRFNVSKNFSEVFDVSGQESELVMDASPRFDMAAFKQMMGRHQLRFQDENQDTIGLFHLAEKENWTWLEAYQVAKETAIDQEISIKRMKESLQRKHTSVPTGEFSAGEQALIRESKRQKPLEFLTLIKQEKKAHVLASERNCLKELATLGLLDEVINVIVFYTFKQVQSANLNEKYALKLGNDFSYKEIRTAEVAIQSLREGNNRRPKSSATTKGVEKTNVPEWSKTEIKQEKTPEEQEKLEALRRQMLHQESRGGE